MESFKTSALFPQYETLTSYFKNYIQDGICIAYSGGVDSTLLLKAAVDAVHGVASHTQDNQPALIQNSQKPSAADPETDNHTLHQVLAVILETQLHPHSDTEQAYALAQKLGAKPVIIQVDEFQNPEILHNPTNRCYLCKHMLFSQLKELAYSRGYQAIFDGTNKDDESEYRPGMKVLKELQIRSPLLELGITKTQVRQLSSMVGLPTASVPSTPCLATRLPYGAYLDRTLLARIHAGEESLRKIGFYNVRLRYHDPILRLEINCDEFEQMLAKREEILSDLKELGFAYITLDLEGFRSGSMDTFL